MGLSNAAAIKWAGYSSVSPNAVDTQAYRISHHPGVQQAILEESQKLMRREGPKSIRTLVEIRDNKKNEPKDRTKAAIELLNRSGFHAISQHNVNVEHHLSEAETDRRILLAAKELGLSETEARKMLVAPGDFEKNSAGVYELAEAPKPEASPQQQRNNERRSARRKMSPEEAAADKERVRAEHAERLRKEYAAHQTTVTDAEFEEVEPDPLADLVDVL
jgi:hypothetical protein